MPSKKLLVGVAAAVVFVAGAGYLVYAGRPVMKNTYPASSSQGQTTTPPTGNPGGNTAGSGEAKTYTMADVQMHNTKADCWSAIGGNVYDLTSWVSRHPGGEGPIIGLCGTDGTTAFTNKHGNGGKPKSMLALLKIGTLQ